MAATGPGPLPPSLTVRPSGKVISSMPCRSCATKPSVNRTTRGNSGSTASTVSDVTEINSDMGDPSNGGLPGLARADRPGFTSCRGQTTPAKYNRCYGQSPSRNWKRRSTRHQPGALEPEPQRLPMDRGDDLQRHQRQREHRSQQLPRVHGAAAAIESCSEQGAVAVRLQDAQPDPVRRRHDTEMAAHRHFDEGRDVEKLFLALAQAGGTDLSLLYRNPARARFAKAVAHILHH